MARDITESQLRVAVERNGFEWRDGPNDWVYLPCGCGMGLKPVFGKQTHREQLSAALRWKDRHICNRSQS